MQLKRVTPALIGVKERFHLFPMPEEPEEDDLLIPFHLLVSPSTPSTIISRPSASVTPGSTTKQSSPLKRVVQPGSVTARPNLGSNNSRGLKPGFNRHSIAIDAPLKQHKATSAVSNGIEPRVRSRRLSSAGSEMEETLESEGTESESISIEAAGKTLPTNIYLMPSIPSTPTFSSFPPPLPPFTPGLSSISPPTTPVVTLSDCNSTHSSHGLDTPDSKPQKTPLPYQIVIDSLEKLNSTNTPVSKLECLTKAANGILSCVDEFYTGKKQNIIMGAEDKFPVLIYALIRANIEDLYSNIEFLQDFVTNNIGDEESKYRASELTDAISYIQSLDWEIRDSNGVLVPLKMIISSVTWAIKAVEKLKIEVDPDNTRTQIIFCVSALFRLIGNQKQNVFEKPLRVPDEYTSLIQRYESFFMSVIGTQSVGLKLAHYQQEQQQEDSNYWIHYQLKLPLHVYTKIADACVSEVV